METGGAGSGWQVIWYWSSNIWYVPAVRRRMSRCGDGEDSFRWFVAAFLGACMHQMMVQGPAVMVEALCWIRLWASGSVLMV